MYSTPYLSTGCIVVPAGAKGTSDSAWDKHWGAEQWGHVTGFGTDCEMNHHR